MKANRFLLAASGAGLLAFSISVSRAQDQTPAVTNEVNQADEIKTLRQRVDELERLVRQLQAREIATNLDKAQPRVQELEQKVKVLESERESDKAAAEEK